MKICLWFYHVEMITAGTHFSKHQNYIVRVSVLEWHNTTKENKTIDLDHTSVSNKSSKLLRKQLCIVYQTGQLPTMLPPSTVSAYKWRRKNRNIYCHLLSENKI